MDQKYKLLTSIISIHDFAQKLFEYEHGTGYICFSPGGSAMMWSSWDFPEQVKEMYLIKAFNLLEWLNENREKSDKCACGCDCVNADCKCK